MRRFKSPGHAQRFLSSFGTIASFFRLVGIFWRLITTGRSCAVASHSGANLQASNLSVDRQSRSPTSSLSSRPLFASIPTKLTIPPNGNGYEQQHQVLQKAIGSCLQILGNAAANHQCDKQQHHAHHRAGKWEVHPPYRNLADELEQQQACPRATHLWLPDLGSIKWI
jgi:hypothetical protein